MTPSLFLLVAGVLPHLEALNGYLRQFDRMADLPELSVHYGDTALHGQHFVNVRNGRRPKNSLLARTPTVTWDTSSTHCGLLLFVDIDAGGGSVSNRSAGHNGPFVHALWTHCKEGFDAGANCRVAKKYQPPGNTDAIPNRYAYILFRHACSADLRIPTSFRYARDKLSFASLLEENPSLAPVSANFLYAGAARG
jgi:hypothetical protein